MNRETFRLSQKELQRGRPSPRRLPEPGRARILDLARTRYAGFNDLHLCEKLSEVEGISLGRETLRRLLRSAGIGSPRKRRAPAHRQRRLARAREGEMLLLDAFPDPTPAQTLQLRRLQGSGLRITGRESGHPSRTNQTPPRRWLTSQGVTFSWGR
jgi:hypothetical protein